MLFQNILCTFLGHKADKQTLAYRIKGYDTFYAVKVYEVSKCSRCNKIYEKLIAQAKEENKLFDFTAGKARNSIIILKNGNVVVSTASSNDIVVALKE